MVDLYFLDRRGLRVADHFEAAKQKEGGLDAAMMSFVIARMQIDEVPGYVLEPLTLRDLRNFAESLRKMLAEMAYPED